MTSMIDGRQYLHVVWVHTVGRNVWVRRTIFLFFSWYFEESKIHLCKISETRDRHKKT
jgi:hypothetical protein